MKKQQVYHCPNRLSDFGSAALAGCHLSDIHLGPDSSRQERIHFRLRPLVFNGKSGYLNPPKHQSIHGILPVAFLKT